jgi:hypothetical protein
VRVCGRSGRTGEGRQRVRRSAKLIERCSDGVEHQGAEAAFWSACQERIVVLCFGSRISRVVPCEQLSFRLASREGAGGGATHAAPHAGTLGLPARRDVADMLRSEKLRTLRMGGSMCNHGMYRWKDFRGRRESRSPYHGDWIKQPGLVQVS